MARLIGFTPTVNAPNTMYGTWRALGMALAGFSNTAPALVAALFISAAMGSLDWTGVSPWSHCRPSAPARSNTLISTIAVTIMLRQVVPSACSVPSMIGVIAGLGVNKKSNIAAGIMITLAQATSVWKTMQQRTPWGTLMAWSGNR